MNKLIVLSGVPGSGKSYFTKALASLKESHLYIVSSDEIRKQVGGSQSNLDNEEVVWSIFHSLARAYSIDKNGIVILDATHISTDLRVDKYIELKKNFDEAILLIWKVDRQLIEKQNKQREFPLNDDVMEMFFSKFEVASKKDFDFYDKIINVDNNNVNRIIEELNIK